MNYRVSLEHQRQPGSEVAQQPRNRPSEELVWGRAQAVELLRDSQAHSAGERGGQSS